MINETGYMDIEKQCQQELEKLKLEEDSLLVELNSMLNQRTFIDDKIKSLSRLVPTLKIMKNEAEELVHTIQNISESSEKISSKIRQLDSARGHVDECLLRVNDLIDLEICAEGVQQAISDSDYEKGAAHVHRFLSMDQTLLKRTANDMNNVSDMLKSVRTLQEAAAQLRAIVEHKFNDAMNAEDLGSVERFFKIFPLLGMHEEGIKNFCQFLKTKISITAEKNLKSALGTPMADKRFSIIYADTMVLLFEGFARILDTHQPLLETYYGPGRLFSAVKILQEECDKQVKKILIEWSKTRQINKKLQQINELSRMSSSASFSKIEKIDPKDLDILIGEITLMHFRCELYIKFIERKVLSDIDVGIQDFDLKTKHKKLLEQLILNSELSQSKHEILSNYLRLEQYFMEESVAKAINMDIFETTTLIQQQEASSMVDDTFFLIKKCIRRSISTGSLDGICVIINNACRVLENDYCDILKARLKQGYPSGYLDLTQAYNVLQNSIQQGRLQSGDTEQSRTAFIVALNNADNSLEYVTALVETTLKEIETIYPNMNQKERGKLESCLSGISAVSAKLMEILEYGLQQLKSTVLKPRINPWVDQFLNFNHQLTEDELSVYEANESFVQTLIMNLETLLSSFREILTSNNYENFIKVLTTEVAQRMEKVVLKTQFNRLGGLILDKEVRSLAGYITAGTYWSVRDQFVRLTQIATILNFENIEEINDYWGNSNNGIITWRLTSNEIKTILNLRTDFKSEDIKRLRL